MEASNTNRIVVRHGWTIPKQDAHFSSQGLASICLAFCEKDVKEEKNSLNTTCDTQHRPKALLTCGEDGMVQHLRNCNSI